MNEQIRKHKAVFAAYLNMAQQNVFITLQHISQLMEIEETEDLSNCLYKFKVLEELKSSESIKNVTGGERPKSERVQKIISLMHKHFPFLKAFLEAKHKQRVEAIPPSAYKKVLCETFELLNAFRNECSHFSPINDPGVDKRIKNIQKEIVNYLYLCLDGGRRVVADRFKEKIKETDLTFLTGTPRYIYTKEGNKVVATKERSDFYYRLRDDEERISYVGMLLFTSLFLHKKYITIFLDQANLFFPKQLNRTNRNLPETEKKIIREIFSVYRIRLPKERIESQRPEYALGLDMLNDLQKCPAELYDTLSAEDKSIFRVMRERDEDGNETENGEVLLLRHNDRFPYFAIRYLDENHVFNDIRFQVSLGKYRYNFYDKACIDVKDNDKNRTRSLQKEVNGFGRLSEVEYERKTRWDDKIHMPDKDQQPFITDQHAGYIFNGNRIGILFNNDMRNDLSLSNESLLYMPDLKFDATFKGKDARCVPPIAWLSVYELPAIIFHHFLCQKYNIDIHLTESIIKECVQLYQQLFTDIKEGKLTPCIPKTELESYLSTHYCSENFCIHSKDVPEKLLEYLCGEWERKNIKNIFMERSRARVKKILEGTEIRLEKFRKERKMIGNKDNKFGKKRYVDIRPGQLARYLSKDLLFFQPYDDMKNNKVTGLNFQVMQSSLAIYDKSIKELESLFYNANLLLKNNSEMEHPFLRKVLNENPKSTLDFYEAYLDQKEKYLRDRFNDPNESFDKLFRYDNRVKWQKRSKDYYQKLAGRYLSEWLDTNGVGSGQVNYKPIELPRGLFEQAIKRLFIQNLNKATNEKEQKMYLAATSSRANVTYLIAQYFEHILVDKNQEFYIPTKNRFKRTYKYFNIINNKKDKNKLIQTFYTLDEMEKLLAKDSHGKRPIDGRVELYLKSKDARKLTNPQARLQKYLSEYKDSEKVIRRYKVQDMLVFLMAKTLLIEKNIKRNVAGVNDDGTASLQNISNDSLAKIKRYKLQNISPANKAGNILAIPIPFYIKLILKDGTERTISQAAIKLKNYGDFFQFIYDERVRSLLPYIEKAEIDRKLLDEELDYYDLKRTEIFRLSHTLENIIFKKCPDLNNPNSQQYYIVSSDNKGNKKMKVTRNNFRAMLNVLRDMGLLIESDLNDMVDVRNAFGHNHYTTQLKLQRNDIPFIAKAIWQRFDELVQKHKTKK